MREAARILKGVVVVGAAMLYCGLASAQPAACPNPQSPRSLKTGDWYQTSSRATVTPRSDGSILFSPRPGATLVLQPCSQHYHCEVENVQACGDQHGASGDLCPVSLPDRSWVEIHTAYHAGEAVDPLPEDLESCTAGPVVVVGYHARVTSAPASLPIPLHFGPPAAEWWGSSTNANPPECKNPAFWHFALGCNFTISRQQLEHFTHPDTARPLQTSLSHDLTHIVPARPQ
jgi:hypothetical protein